MSIARQEYLNKKNMLIVKNVNQETLEYLKLLYQKDINSTRKTSAIDSVGALIEVLEKRACVSEKDSTILDNIEKEIDSKSPTYQPILTILPKPIFEPKEFGVVEKVHKEIISKLGKHWINFARALGVQDGDIDTFYKKLYSDNPEGCIKTILEFHKNNALRCDWKYLLLEALTSCRRNDLRKRVEYIFEHF